MEICDIYDKNRQRTGRTIPRGSQLAADDYHQIVHVCIVNDRHQMLIQKRSEAKSKWSGLWDLSVGGAVLAGETSAEAAIRETNEELGLTISLPEARPHFSLTFINGFDDFYIVTANPAIADLQLQEEEVTDVRWADEAAIQDMIRRGLFIPYKASHIGLCFALQGPIFGIPGA